MGKLLTEERSPVVWQSTPRSKTEAGTPTLSSLGSSWTTGGLASEGSINNLDGVFEHATPAAMKEKSLTMSKRAAGLEPLTLLQTPRQAIKEEVTVMAPDTSGMRDGPTCDALETASTNVEHLGECITAQEMTGTANEANIERVLSGVEESRSIVSKGLDEVEGVNDRIGLVEINLGTSKCSSKLAGHCGKSSRPHLI